MKGCLGCLGYAILSLLLFIALGWPWAAFHSVPALLAWWALMLGVWCGVRVGVAMRDRFR